MKEAEALWAVWKHQPATSREIADQLKEEGTRASQVLRRLYDRGLVERAGDTTGYEYSLTEGYER